ncbi:hypothetical protein AUK40_04940 [Candidatus Wirthbacteria bacterium CG2_30_54_11]|uniref:Uncharacterized protein n=1 Tax=Candidatus Wirthbacteria bacterium CG2_30_54_11 TaxID=1817892 RepID=A0A1J5IIF9_9BACT|nr:MAG: hypothetical protein AUK40_04940 [Candidatus Wirthbacteria bacterium CG2_30_54_11]
MFYGVDELLKMVQEKKLVTGLCERELTNPEGAGFDLRMADVYRISGKGYLGVENRKTCDIETIATYAEGKVVTATWKPGDFFLVKTIEEVNLPIDCVGILKPRSTLQRMGLMLRATQIAPGYSGGLTVAVANVGPCEVEVELGSRFLHLMVSPLIGNGSAYRGQWQGGRVSALTTEKQV